MDIGKKIKNLRKINDLTQVELSEKANISRSYLADIERNRYNASLDTLKSIASALDVPLDHLTGESIKEIIENELSKLNITVEVLSEKANVPVGFINSLENIDPNEGDYEYINRISMALGLNPSVLKSALAKQESPTYDNRVSMIPSADFSPVSINDFINVPIVGSVRAGQPMLAQDNIEGYNLVPRKDLYSDKEYFYLRVQGDSMNQEFNEGTLLLIEKSPWVENGTIAVVLIDGLEATVKKVIQNGDMITLIPMSNNSEHLPQMYDVVKDQIRIVGRVKQATKVY
jgi:repressor LexA